MLLLFAWVLSIGGILCMLFAWVFRWYLLKPMQIQANPDTNLLKPMQIAAKNKLKTSIIGQKCLKPMCIAANIAHNRPHERKTTCNSKAQREESRLSHALAQLRLARTHDTHVTHDTKRKRRRIRNDLPVAGCTHSTSSP